MNAIDNVKQQIDQMDLFDDERNVDRACKAFQRASKVASDTNGLKEIVEYTSDKNVYFTYQVISELHAREKISEQDLMELVAYLDDKCSQKNEIDENILCYSLVRNHSLISILDDNKTIGNFDNLTRYLIRYCKESQIEYVLDILSFLYAKKDMKWNEKLMSDLAGFHVQLGVRKFKIDNSYLDKFYCLLNKALADGEYGYGYNLIDNFQANLNSSIVNPEELLKDCFGINSYDYSKQYFSLFIALEIYMHNNDKTDKENLDDFRNCIETVVLNRCKIHKNVEIYYRILEVCNSVLYDYDHAYDIIYTKEKIKELYTGGDFTVCNELNGYIEKALKTIFIEKPEDACVFIEFVEPYSNWTYSTRRNEKSPVFIQADYTDMLEKIKAYLLEKAEESEKKGKFGKGRYNDIIYIYMNSFLRYVISLSEFLNIVIDEKDYGHLKSFFKGYLFLGELVQENEREYLYRLNNIRVNDEDDYCHIPKKESYKTHYKSTEVFYIAGRDADKEGCYPYFYKNPKTEFISLHDFTRQILVITKQGYINNDNYDMLRSKRLMSRLRENTRFVTNLYELEMFMNLSEKSLKSVLPMIGFCEYKQRNNFIWSERNSADPHMYPKDDSYEAGILDKKYEELVALNVDYRLKLLIYLNSFLRGRIFLSKFLDDIVFEGKGYDEKKFKSLFNQVKIYARVYRNDKMEGKYEGSSGVASHFFSAPELDQYRVKKDLTDLINGEGIFMMDSYDYDNKVFWLRLVGDLIKPSDNPKKVSLPNA